MIRVIDNLVNPRYADAIENDMISQLTYLYCRETSTDTKYGEYLGPIYNDENVYDCGQFSCPILEAGVNLNHTPYFDVLKPLIYELESKLPELNIVGIRRIKSNILTKQSSLPEYHYNIPHQDAISNSYSMVYYTQDSDGDTFLFNEYYEEGKVPNRLTVAQRVSPKKNRAVIFESNRYHASSNPRFHKDRIIINFVFEAHASNR